MREFTISGNLELWEQEGGYANDAIVIDDKSLDSIIRDKLKLPPSPNVDAGEVEIIFKFKDGKEEANIE